MALGDFFVFDTRNGSAAMSTRYRVESDTDAIIVAGEMIRQDQGAGDTEFVQLEVDGGSNTTIKIGVAASASDEDSSPATVGSVWVFDGPGYIYKGRLSTPSNMSDARRLVEVTMDVAAGTNGRMTIDEDDSTNGTYRILDGDATSGLCIFQIALPDSILGN